MKGGDVMYDENQIVQVRWNNTNELWYKNKGYLFTGKNSLFEVKAKDLTPHSDKRIKVTCDYCGKEFETLYAIITNGRKVIQKDACSCCTGKKSNEVSWKRRANKYFSLAREVCEKEGYELLTDISEFTDVKMMIDFLCPKHGVQSMMLDNFVRGHKCKDCSYETRFVNMKLDKDYIHKIVRSKGDEWLNPDEYTTCIDRNMKIRCLCGNVFTTSFVNFSKANIFRCPTCSQKESLGELKIREFLDSHSIKYEQEKRFVDCRDKKPLPFDFYLPAYNMCIEFDGQQHYQDKYGLQALQTTQHHDKIKNDYCVTAGIKLLRIPYWDGSKVDNILTKELIL